MGRGCRQPRDDIQSSARSHPQRLACELGPLTQIGTGLTRIDDLFNFKIFRRPERRSQTVQAFLIFSGMASGSSAAAISAQRKPSIPPSMGKDPQSPDGHAAREVMTARLVICASGDPESLAYHHAAKRRGQLAHGGQSRCPPPVSCLPLQTVCRSRSRGNLLSGLPADGMWTQGPAAGLTCVPHRRSGSRHRLADFRRIWPPECHQGALSR